VPSQPEGNRRLLPNVPTTADPPNNSMEPTRPAAANRISDIIEALAGRLISRPLGAGVYVAGIAMSEAADPSKLVRQGYNKIAAQYLAARSSASPDAPALAHFSSLLPTNALVLDAGCGAGVPVTHFLAQYHRVVAIDFSIAQAQMASGLVPSAHVACLDMTQLAFPPAIFDGICSLFAILHIPRSKHRNLIAAFHRLLREDGLVLLCLGASDNEADYGPYFGTRMFWSHFDSREYLEMLTATGFTVLSSEILPDPISKIATHLFVLARKDGA